MSRLFSGAGILQTKYLLTNLTTYVQIAARLFSVAGILQIMDDSALMHRLVVWLALVVWYVWLALAKLFIFGVSERCILHVELEWQGVGLVVTMAHYCITACVDASLGSPPPKEQC